MNTEKAFKMYLGMHLHFTSLKYSVLTYGTNTKSAQTKYESLTQAQRYRFEWLASKFVAPQDLVYACIGCEFAGVNLQYDTKDDVMEAYLKFKARRESLTYTIKNDISKHEILEFIPVNKLIFKYFIGQTSPEYILLISDDVALMTLYESANMAWAREKILKLIKYSGFFNKQKYSHLIKTPQQQPTV